MTEFWPNGGRTEAPGGGERSGGDGVPRLREREREREKREREEEERVARQFKPSRLTPTRHTAYDPLVAPQQSARLSHASTLGATQANVVLRRATSAPGHAPAP
jgi:hypothetical protein